MFGFLPQSSRFLIDFLGLSIDDLGDWLCAYDNSCRAKSFRKNILPIGCCGPEIFLRFDAKLLDSNGLRGRE
jgi:hypothetical protein